MTDDDGDGDTVKGAAAASATAESQEDASAPGTTAHSSSSKNSNNDGSGSAAAGQNGQTQYKPNGGSPQTIAEAAAHYHDKRGWNPVPVSRRTKKPFEKEWQNLPYSPDRFKRRKTLNLGLQFGPVSGNLVDTDLDSKEALEYADYFLPDTNGIFGRASKPRSHRLYIADFSFEGEKAVIQFKDGDAMIVELRIGAGGKGAQSVAPPSVNGSGEVIEWVNDQPTPVDARALKGAVTRLAVACLLAPRYPKLGSRHDAAIVLGGVFARAGWSAEEIEILVALVARKAGCSAWDAHGKTAADAVAVMATGKPVSGLNRLSDVWGEDVAKAFEKWGIGSRLSERVQKAQASGLPIIRIEEGKRKEITDQAEDAILKTDNNGGLYQRGGLIVRVGYEKMKTWDEKDVETQAIIECGGYYLKETIGSFCTFIKCDGRSRRDVVSDPPEWISDTLKQRHGLLRLPILNGVSNCPILRANGELIAKPGYHAETGLYYDPRGVRFPDIAREPSKEDARAALNRIKRLFHTFPWVVGMDKKQDRGCNRNLSVALSFLLTTVARRALDFAIMHAFDAPVAGSGKSMINDIVSLIATGDRAAVIAHTEDQREFDKLFDAIQMRGLPLIPIDNCEVPLRGTKLNQAITQPIIDCRILGESKIVRVRSLATISANGNNLVLEGDLTRRTACGRMDPGCERPELLKFNYSPLNDATENRGELVAAALTVLRAYHVAGRPVREILRGFEEWSILIRGALLWLGEADPLETMDEVRKSDPIRSALQMVMHQWATHWPCGRPVTTATMVEKANEWDKGYVHPEWRDALMTVAATGNNISNRRFGTWLGNNKGRAVGFKDDKGAYLVQIELSTQINGIQQWMLTRRELSASGEPASAPPPPPADEASSFSVPENGFYSAWEKEHGGFNAADSDGAGDDG
jgi:hypothetical protein